MARKEIVIWTDDMTGEPVEDVIREIVCVEGIAYALDLGPESHAAYLALIEPYRAAGTRIGRAAESNAGGVVRSITSAASSVARTVADKAQNKAVREWWRRHGEAAGLGPVVERGRIPEAVLMAYNQSGGRAPKVETPSAPAEPPVEAKKEPRKATTVGANVKVSSGSAPQAQFSSATAEVPKPRGGRVKAAAPAKAAQPAATGRKRRTA